MEGFLSVLVSGVTGLLFIGLGLPLANGKVPPNRWYGYRVSRYQLEDDDMWYEINKKGGVHFVLAGVGCLVLATVSILFIGNPKMQVVMLTLLTVLLLAYIAYEIRWSVRAARRMARDKGLSG
ncbi:MAG: SdpI family protein [Actinobacteria bacterium]|nr:SdpI family protein [Actinomycetota bacterium]